MLHPSVSYTHLDVYKRQNLTMPDKNLMCTYCDKLSPAAELIGAVNTVVNDNGVLTGHTTDGIGYMEAARDAGYDLTGKTMTLLGGGGAATAICVQAALDGLKEIRVFNIKDQFYGRLEKLTANITARTSCKVTLHDPVSYTHLCQTWTVH